MKKRKKKESEAPNQTPNLKRERGKHTSSLGKKKSEKKTKKGLA